MPIDEVLVAGDAGPEEQTHGGLSVGRAFLLMLLGWSVGFAAAAGSRLVFGTAGTSAVGNVVGLGVMGWVGYRNARRRLHQVFAIRGFSAWLLLPMAVMALSGLTLVSEVGSLAEEIVAVPKALREMLLEILKADDLRGFLWRWAMLCVMAPVTEEAVFRGIFQSGFVRRYGRWRGIAAASVCFGVFHVIPWQAVSTVLVGVLLGVVVYRTGSIFAGMAMHAIWNALPLLAVSLMDDRMIEAYGLRGDQVVHVPIGALVVASGIFWLGLRAFWRRTEGLSATDAPQITPAQAEQAGLGSLPPSGGPDGPPTAP